MPYPKPATAVSNVRSFYGVQDFQDTATGTTPISLTAGGWTDITSDGLGPLSSQDAAVLGHGPIYDTTAQQLNFSDLNVFDMLHLRVDVTFITTSPNIDAGLRLAFGPSFTLNFPLFFDTFRAATSGSVELGRVVPYEAFQMKSTLTTDNPAKFQAYSSGSGTTLEVEGWQIETTVLGV